MSEVCDENNDNDLYAGDPSDEYVFYVSSVSASKQPKTNVLINDTVVSLLVDSGAGVNILDEVTYEKLKKNVVLSECKERIMAYGSKMPLPARGKVLLTVKSKVSKKTIQANFHVIKGASGNLLGYESATKLGLLHVLHAVAPSSDVMYHDFPGVLNGIGKMKDKQVKLHIDESVKPMAQQYRRIPFHVRDLVDEELARLECLGVIEKAEGPTPWVSPIVVVPKPNGKIRICVDMRGPNLAIECERHPCQQLRTSSLI